MRYTILIENGENNYSAYAPDVPGCAATGKTLEEVKEQMKGALEFHFEGMMLDREPVPKPTIRCCYIDVDVTRIEKSVRRKHRTPAE
jgi:predicted RNase H-like HicB family nuclease